MRMISSFPTSGAESAARERKRSVDQSASEFRLTSDVILDLRERLNRVEMVRRKPQS
jgi:hypothetical protein